MTGAKVSGPIFSPPTETPVEPEIETGGNVKPGGSSGLCVGARGGGTGAGASVGAGVIGIAVGAAVTISVGAGVTGTAVGAAVMISVGAGVMGTVGAGGFVGAPKGMQTNPPGHNQGD